MKSKLWGVLLLITICLFVMDFWTYTIFNEVTGDWETKENGFQYLEDSPISGSVKLTARPNMYESVSANVEFNITISIMSSIPMNLTIERIEIMLTPADYPSTERADVPKTIGSSKVKLKLVNVSSINIDGRIMITPVILDGENDVYLGVGVTYYLKNHSLSEPNIWGGSDGSLFMLPVQIYPFILRNEGWFCASGAVLLIWGVIAAYKYKNYSQID